MKSVRPINLFALQFMVSEKNNREEKFRDPAKTLKMDYEIDEIEPEGDDYYAFLNVPKDVSIILKFSAFICFSWFLLRLFLLKFGVFCEISKVI